MPDKDFYTPQLTRKEIKLIKMLRMQSDEQQKEIYEKIKKLFNEWIENGRNVDEDDDGDEQEASWLNSEYYK